MFGEEFFNSATIESMLASRRTEKWHTYPPDVIPLALAETDFPLAPQIKQAFLKSVQEEDTSYMGTQEIQRHLEAIAAKVSRRNGLEASADDVMVTHAVSAGMWQAIKCSCEPGDEVVVTNPMYGPFYRAIDRTGMKALYWQLDMEEGYKFDIEKLNELITKKTSLIFVCNPHNPSGRVMTKEELKGIGDIAVDNNIAIWVDELWEDFILDGRKHISLASLSPEIADLTMTSWGFSKTYGLSGLRLGYFCATNKETMKRIHGIFNDVIYRVPPASTISMSAMPVMLDDTLDSFRKGINKHIQMIRDLCEKRLGEIPRVTYPKMEGTYVMFPKFDYGMTGDELQQYLYEEARVRFSSGTHYGTGGEGHLRLVIASSEAIINEVFDRVEKALNKLK